MIRTGLYTFGFLRMTLAACVGIPLIIASNAFAQNLAPAQTLTGAAPLPATPEANRGLVNVMSVDLNSIPQAGIESIEILKDGASTTYGADAVAGVVNLKMRHRYDGAESRVEYGNTLDKDSGLFDASAVFGVGKED